jgi:1-deoxy-D-xylulose-5-phosphate reductoisomerase
MNQSTSSIALMGSTGSIGRSALEVVAASERFDIKSLSAHSQLPAVVDQAREFKPRFVVASDESQANGFDWSALPSDTEVLFGPDGLDQVARSEDVDIVIAAIVGSAGLRSTWAALEAGKRVALANKETLVVAGPLVRELVDERGGELLPVDSEHSAIFQALAAGRRQDVHRVLLTASGGPFRGYTQSQLENVTVKQALAHPTWEMGTKITIDSATMMNKALEIIEARWLFDLKPSEIDVVVHPQSIVHSMVEYIDGSVVAQMSPPDMKLPIQYALTYPERCESPAEKCDFSQPMSLEFEPPDHDLFPAVRLGLEVARVGGTAGVVVNAANEVAVEKFIGGELKFTEIVPACRAVLENHEFDPRPKLDDLFRLDHWAREEVTRWVCI